MSDIQEEMKRLYKRAEKYDKENRRLLKEIHDKEINELQDKLNKYKDVFDKIKNYINDKNRELSVDSYYEFKDLSEFDDINKILEEIE